MSGVPVEINLLHVFAVFPFIFYMGYKKIIPFKPEYLQGLGVLVGLYHGYVARKKGGLGVDDAGINLLHVFIVAPFLILLGRDKFKSKEIATLTMVLAVLGGLYHLFQVYAKKDIFLMKETYSNETEENFSELSKDISNSDCKSKVGSYNV